MKYEIDRNTICFQSYPEFYFKEKTGIKNNTVRLNPTANQINNIMDWWNTIDTKYVKIVNSENKESFSRKLLDITEYMNVIVFTWKS
jgi:hypothetical protein